MRSIAEIRFKPALLALAVAFVLLIISPGLVRAKDVRVAVLPWTVNGPEDISYLKGALTDMLSSRIGVSDIVEIVRTDEVKRAIGVFGKDGVVSARAAIKIGKRLMADYIVYGSISVLGASVSLDVKLVNVNKGSSMPIYASGEGISSVVEMAAKVSKAALDSIRMEADVGKPDLSYIGKFSDAITEEEREHAAGKIPKAPVKPATGSAVQGTLPTGKAGKEKGAVKVVTRSVSARTLKRRSVNIDGFFVSLTSADLDKDGTDEIFLVSEASVVIASYGLKGLSIIQELKAPDKAQNLFVSSGDIDNDGYEDVFLARLINGKPGSVIIEYSDGKYSIKEPKGLDNLVRVINIQGEGDQLIAQDFRIKSGFFRKIVKLKKDKDGYTEDGELQMPREVISRGITSFQIFDLDSDGTNEIVSLGKKGSLRVYKAAPEGKFEEYWRSPEVFGGSLNELMKPDEPGDEYFESDDGFYIFSGIEYGDFDSDGAVELMVKRNILTGLARYARKVRSYKSSSLHRLSWNVALMDEEWKSKELSGYISDFVVADLDGDGSNEVTILIVEINGKFLRKSKAKSYLLTYSII